LYNSHHLSKHYTFLSALYLCVSTQRQEHSEKESPIAICSWN
jgi:hypothetical protein